MMRQDLLLPCRIVDMGIYLRGRNTLMAEHLLHYTKVRSMLQQMGSEGMTESMRGYLLSDSGSQGLSLYHREHGHPPERPAEAI